MKFSPGTIHTFDSIPGHGTVRVVWAAVWPEINEKYGHPLPGRRVFGALEWHEANPQYIKTGS